MIVDNGSGHRGKKAIKRLKGKYASCIMIHTPLHASWLNQIEIFFIWSLPAAVLDVRHAHSSDLVAAL